MTTEVSALRVGIAGLGTIGMEIARRLVSGEVSGVELSGVSAKDHAKARRNLQGLNAAQVPVVTLGELSMHADVVVECAPASVFLEAARPAIDASRIFIPLSVGVLLANMDLVARARDTGATIFVPSGALLGLDAVRAVSQGTVSSVTLVTRKPPGGLQGAPHLIAEGIELGNLTEPLRVFAGNALAAARGFPANVNVGAALALAGIGPERTQVEIWADPNISRNTHTVVVESDSSRLHMTIENIPSPEHPATGKVTALSVIACLRRLTEPLVVGS